MKQTAKAFLILLTAVALVFAFAACGEEAAPAAEPDTEAETTTVEVGEGAPDIVLKGAYTEGEVTEDWYTVFSEVKHYVDPAGIFDFYLAYANNEEGLTLEEYAAVFGEAVTGCVENSQWEGVPCCSVPHFVSENGKNYIVDSFIFDLGDRFAVCEFWNNTEEVQIGTGDCYIWLPLLYEAAAITDETQTDFIASYEAPEDTALPQVFFLEWADDSWTYETVTKAHGDDPPISEEQFNALLADGFTLDEQQEYYNTVYQPEDTARAEINGLTMAINQVLRESNGEQLRSVFITLLNEETHTFNEVVLSTPADSRIGHGEAFAYAIHTK